MKDDAVMKLLRQVKSGEVDLDDARKLLDGVDITEEAYVAAVDHGVFNEPAPGSVVRASISPSGDSWLIILVGLWGLFWRKHRITTQY